MHSDAPSYPGYRFPTDIIPHAAWLYHTFSLSYQALAPTRPFVLDFLEIRRAA